MTTQHTKTDDKQRRKLLAYPIIICAIQGDPIAMDKVVAYYTPTIIYLSKRLSRDVDGYLVNMTNADIEARLTSRLVCAVIRFKIITSSGEV